LVLNFAVLRVA